LVLAANEPTPRGQGLYGSTAAFDRLFETNNKTVIK
jgi:hypothetical protein